MKTAILTALLAALLAGLGPWLDEQEDAGITAAMTADARTAAIADDSMARWARRVCRTDLAATLQVEGSDVVCRDVSGQRVGAIAIRAEATP